MGLNGKGYRGIVKHDPCVYCGVELAPGKTDPLRFTADHIVPKNQGGGNHWMNLAPACSRCNNKKGNNSLLGHLLGQRILGRFFLGHEYENYAWEGDVQATGAWFDPLNVKGYQK